MGGKIPLSSPKDTEPLGTLSALAPSSSLPSIPEAVTQSEDFNQATMDAPSQYIDASSTDATLLGGDATTVEVQASLTQTTPVFPVHILQTPVTLQKIGDALIDMVITFTEKNFASQSSSKAPHLTGLLNQEMNFNALNKSQDNLLSDLSLRNKKVQTIRAFIKEQLIQLTTTPPTIQSVCMQIAAVINGIARALATKLGDMLAQREIARQLVTRLDLGSMVHTAVDSLSPYETDFITANTAALSQSNPVIQYVHDELNSHDAAMYTITGAEACGLDSAQFYEQQKQQAQVQIKALHALNQKDNTIIAASTQKLPFEDPAGMYSKRFFEETIQSDGNFTTAYHDKIQKLDGVFTALLAKPAAQRHFGKYKTDEIAAIEKAKKHQAKVAAPVSISEESTTQPLTFRERALQKIGALAPKADPEAILNQLEEIFTNAPITISRFAENMLVRELFQPETSDHVLSPGTVIMGVSMEEVVFGEEGIRYGLGNVRKKPQMQPGDIAYVPLLDIHSGEGAVRKSAYPIFRNNKNHRFDAKAAEEANTPVFGSLCLDPVSASHGFMEGGEKAGVFGDVTLVLNDTIKKSGRILYTNTDRGRGYTDLNLFLYSIFQPTKEMAKKEQLIPGGTFKTAYKTIPMELIEIAKGKPASNFVTQNLEVQIFMDVKLTKEHIQAVYFANSIDSHNRDAIIEKLSLPPKNPASDYKSSSQDIFFYQYMLNPVILPHLEYIQNTLYCNKGRNKGNPISLDEINFLIQAPISNLSATVKNIYTVQTNPTLFEKGEGEEFEHICKAFLACKALPKYIAVSIP